MQTFLVKLVSHFLSNSSLWFLSLMFNIYFSKLLVSIVKSSFHFYIVFILSLFSFCFNIFYIIIGRIIADTRKCSRNVEILCDGMENKYFAIYNERSDLHDIFYKTWRN